jgi:hypothetical protein
MSGTTKQSSKKNKLGNKRARPSPEEQYRLESVDRYDKLCHACTKHLHREAKVVKSFECQKIVRAIKVAKDAVSGDHPAAEDDDNIDDEKNDKDKETNKVARRIETLQHKLERTKKMDLDILVQVGLKRLGVVSLDPRLDPTHAVEHNNTIDDIKDDKKSQKTLSPQQFDDPFFQTLLESMFRHKRLSTALDQMNDKVTEYRQWTTRWETMQRGEIDNSEDNPHGGGNKKKNKKMNQNDTIVVAASGGFNSRRRGDLDMGGHEGTSGIFIGSLAGHPIQDAGDGDGDEDMGDDDDDEYGTSKKKNRPGQRARKAKATAIEARKAGKTWDSSMNWREKKKGDNIGGLDGGKKDYNNSRGGTEQHKRNDNDRGSSNSVVVVPKAAPQHIASMGKTWKDEGNAHPSWVAAAAQKSQGIAKFEGKKITFA